jgi:hypothetical protein
MNQQLKLTASTGAASGFGSLLPDPAPGARVELQTSANSSAPILDFTALAVAVKFAIGLAKAREIRKTRGAPALSRHTCGAVVSTRYLRRAERCPYCNASVKNVRSLEVVKYEGQR